MVCFSDKADGIYCSAHSKKGIKYVYITTPNLLALRKMLVNSVAGFIDTAYIDSFELLQYWANHWIR